MNRKSQSIRQSSWQQTKCARLYSYPKNNFFFKKTALGSQEWGPYFLRPQYPAAGEGGGGGVSWIVTSCQQHRAISGRGEGEGEKDEERKIFENPGLYSVLRVVLRRNKMLFQSVRECNCCAEIGENKVSTKTGFYFLSM